MKKRIDISTVFPSYIIDDFVAVYRHEACPSFALLNVIEAMIDRELKDGDSRVMEMVLRLYNRHVAKIPAHKTKRFS